ncbi:DUF2383 domain-containing protein [Fonticella tunisiensis]|uniref:Rubrerythrin n=1 Tax=Fonticella tunisiensis TaxID=1096341 RepID=A0A4V3ESV2_9CLOT|nr:DUF2383 domain-containing protein [Fonticella tunisiensis]TDT51880.1 rubrerythrin [Fonticella tunisiensis]
MNNTTINELNTLLKGEYMAIDGYEKFIQSVDNMEAKKTLQNIQQDHKMHAIMIAERIQNLGGTPVDGVGIIGRVSEVISNIKDGREKSDIQILKRAYDGEDVGIKMATEVVKGDLDDESLNLVKGMLDDDRSHLTTLNNMISQIGGISSL